ncbi:hypothetical protein ScPMuIL_003416 [Solemya velum]
MEKNLELKTIEKYLMPHLERFQQSGEQTRSQRDIAMGWALATFLRSVGVSKVSHNSMLERIQSFVMKEKKGLKLPGSSKPKTKIHKGHQFVPQHYYKVEFCMQCGSIIWGIGYQGFMCQTCEQSIHKQCIDDLDEMCKKKRFRSSGIMWRKQQPVPMPQAAKEVDKDVSSPTLQPDPNPFNVPPAKTEEDPELSGIRDVHSVGNWFRSINPSWARTGRGMLRWRRHQAPVPISNGPTVRDHRPTRRTASDLEMSDDIVSILRDKSGSSSSLSNKSMESPSASLVDVNDSIQYDSDLEVDTELPPLKHIIAEDELKKLKPKEKKRQDVLNELFHTEKAHVRNLKILDKLFYRPMSKSNISQDLTEALFPNLSVMIQLHCSINNDMKARRRETSVVKKVSDILLRRFDNEEGKKFRNSCAICCRNQSHAIEALKLRQKKDQRLSQFLSDAESNPLCRRLQLKDLVPAQMQRLTKYPMLIENLLKYTQTNTEEHSDLERAHQCSKHILEYVNQAVRDTENHQRLLDLQRRIDKKQVENSSDLELVEELKALDLRHHKLVHDGPLTWRINPRKNIELHVVLLEDMVVLLQKQDDKLVLKCQSSQLVPGRDELKHTHSPLLRLSELLTRNAATDKRAFFAVNTSKSGPQIYELVAPTADEQKKWSKHISQAAEAYKNRELRPTRTVPEESSTNQPEPITVEENRLNQEHTMEEDQPEGLTDQDKKNLMQLRAPGQLVQPSQILVSDAVLEKAKSVLTPIELLRQNDEQIQQCLRERERLVAQVFSIPHTEFPDRAKAAKEAGIEGKPEDLMMAFIEQSNEMITLIANCSQDVVASRNTTSDSSKEELQQLTIPIPMEKLHEMASRMNQILTNLLAVINSRDEERERLRTELKAAQEQLDFLRQIQKATAVAYASKARPSSMMSETSTTSETCEDSNIPQVEITRVDSQECEKGSFPVENHIDSPIAKDEGVVSDDPEDLHEIEPPEEDRMDELPPEQVEEDSAEDETNESAQEEALEEALEEETTSESAMTSEAGIHQVAEVKSEELDAEQVTDMKCTEIVQNSEDVSTELQHAESEDFFEDATDKLDTGDTQDPCSTSKEGAPDDRDIAETVQEHTSDNSMSLDNMCTDKDNNVGCVDSLATDENSTDLDAVILENLKESAIEIEQDSESTEKNSKDESISNWGEDAPPSVEI